MLVCFNLALLACAQAPEPAPADVRLYHDELGVPHVFAASDAGVFRGLGYAQGRDFPVATLANLWSATGRFAEIAGQSALARDERLRQWGLDRRAHELAADPAELDPAVRAWLEAYVDGVNLARRWWLAQPERLEHLAGEGGSELLFDPVPLWLHPQTAQEDERARRARLRHLFESEVTLEHVLALGLALAAGPEFGGGGYSTRTNVWMMRGSERDPSVRVLSDVHQPLEDFGYRSYFVQLSGPSYDLVGYTSPGFPCIVLGTNAHLAFASMTLPKTPRELRSAKLPFRIDERAPLVATQWTAKLEADSVPRFLRGTEVIALREERVTLRYWDATAKALADDPRGALTLRWVPDDPAAPRSLVYPVVVPAPDQALDPAKQAEIRFEGRSFQNQRSLWETWIELGLCRRVGAGEGGIERVLAREGLATGRGQLFLASDVEGGFEFLWSTRVPVLGDAALARWRAGDAMLDGRDPEQRWRGFQPFAALPRLVQSGSKEKPLFAKEPAAWIECNSSPEFVSASSEGSAFGGAATIYDGQPWKTRRQDRARELFARAARDGVLADAELERMALDVQDQWSRASWPLIHALAVGSRAPLSPRALAFVAWLDAFRCEGADGRPGGEEFLAHPLSQVMPFLALVRDRFEDDLIAARAPAAALALAFDPCASMPEPAVFLAEDQFEPARVALREAVEWSAELREKTLARAPGGLVNTSYFAELAARLQQCGSLFANPWSDPLYTHQAPEWGPAAPPVALRWGEVNVYALTPHRWSGEVTLKKPAQVEEWLRTIFAPCETLSAPSFYHQRSAAVFPIGGTYDSLFQVHREGFASHAKSLLVHEGGFLSLAPVDFGSQALFLAELRAGARPRVRVLPALGATELLGADSESGRAALELFRPTARFARGEWSALETDEEKLRASAGVRRMTLGE